MDILGIGGLELVMILIIMIVVAGPKRMIQWSYLLGRELAKVRKMWGETAKMLQKEFDAAGIDIQVPEQVPTRGTLKTEAMKMLTPITKPMQDAMNEVQGDLDEVRKTAAMIPGARTPTTVKPGASKFSPAPKPSAADEPPSPPVTETPVPAVNGSSTAPADSFGAWGGQTRE
jgi:sec-independent protein translocase protein TatB